MSLAAFLTLLHVALVTVGAASPSVALTKRGQFLEIA